jgi:hypothetical protein
MVREFSMDAQSLLRADSFFLAGEAGLLFGLEVDFLFDGFGGGRNFGSAGIKCIRPLLLLDGETNSRSSLT